MTTGATRFGIDELGDFAGVSRRTVRYYVQEGLLPPPLGVGRGRHYDQRHLDRLLQVKALQEAGRSLDEIRDLLHSNPTRSPVPGRPDRPRPNAPRHATAPTVRAAAWHRFELGPGVELHVAAHARQPSPATLEQLVEWCRLHFAPARDIKE